MSDLKKIAITGTIGSGKSTVLKYLKEKGFECFSCDEYNAILLKENKEVISLIKKSFPVVNDGIIDKKALASIVFNNKESLDLLESITHPFIIEKMKELLEDDKTAFFEVPLLFEEHLESLFEKTICVSAYRQVRISRLLNRGLTMRDIISRELNQMPDQIKENQADYLIDNSYDLEYLYKQVEKVLKELNYDKC
ncbi:MAG: dephospho-CoA kinase [Erysipelotrichaceae bacterium]|nr:dephospho-CoA kinase [Erysipelotrichaceae bacterium]